MHTYAHVRRHAQGCTCTHAGAYYTRTQRTRARAYTRGLARVGKHLRMHEARTGMRVRTRTQRRIRTDSGAHRVQEGLAVWTSAALPASLLSRHGSAAVMGGDGNDDSDFDDSQGEDFITQLCVLDYLTFVISNDK
eukprot:6199716-Pleurochrysis_carterae.AAC.3